MESLEGRAWVGSRQNRKSLCFELSSRFPSGYNKLDWKCQLLFKCTKMQFGQNIYTVIKRDLSKIIISFGPFGILFSLA